MIRLEIGIGLDVLVCLESEISMQQPKCYHKKVNSERIGRFLSTIFSY